jgi:membrane dipeptidase
VPVFLYVLSLLDRHWLVQNKIRNRIKKEGCHVQIIDMHCDTLPLLCDRQQPLLPRSGQGHLDLERMQEGGVKLQFFALFPNLNRESRPLLRTLHYLDYFAREQLLNQKNLLWIKSREDLENCFQSTAAGALISIEGGEALEGDIRMLHTFYRLGVRSLCLTWNYRNQLADGAGETDTGGGLSNFGKEVVQEMESLGMLIDLSHISEPGFWSALEQTTGPLVCSHSNCRSLCDHRRNLSDQQIKAIAARDGVVGVNFVPYFVADSGAGVDELIRHIDHICTLVGDQYVGFGSDFDGTDEIINGVCDVTSYPAIVSALQRQGYSNESLSRICCGNVRRLLARVLPAAAADI